MKTVEKQDWTAPELVEYGDVTKLTEVSVKTGGSSDALCADNLSSWVSGSVN